jgi:hypothetical protein
MRSLEERHELLLKLTRDLMLAVDDMKRVVREKGVRGEFPKVESALHALRKFPHDEAAYGRASGTLPVDAT